jgi:hypothetical protein
MWTDTARQQYARAELLLPSDLTDPEWAILEPLLPPASLRCSRCQNPDFQPSPNSRATLPFRDHLYPADAPSPHSPKPCDKPCEWFQAHELGLTK